MRLSFDSFIRSFLPRALLLWSVNLCWVALGEEAMASNTGWRFSGSAKEADRNAQFHQRCPAAFQDDVTPDQTASTLSLTMEEKHQAAVWDLTEEQEKRYLFLMKNKTGLYYADKKMSPVEILGVNARDDDERAHYAALYASQTLQRNAKELAFYSQSGKAFQELVAFYALPVVHPFNLAPYAPYSSEKP